MERWWWVSMSWATFGIGATDGIVTDAPPIAAWAHGKSIDPVLTWFRTQKGSRIVALTEEQEREIALQEQAAKAMAVGSVVRSSRKANRNLSALASDQKKQRFVDDFIAGDKLADYPDIAVDIVDENRDDLWYDAPSLLTMREALAAELRHAFDMLRPPKDLDPRVVANELLNSESGDERQRLKELPLSELSVALVAAHLESLDYKMTPRLTVSSARRTMLILLNRRHFKPDGRPKKKRQAVA